MYMPNFAGPISTGSTKQRRGVGNQRRNRRIKLLQRGMVQAQFAQEIGIDGLTHRCQVEALGVLGGEGVGDMDQADQDPVAGELHRLMMEAGDQLTASWEFPGLGQAGASCW